MDTVDFDPALRLRGQPEVWIRTLYEAERFLHAQKEDRGRNRDGILRQLQVAKSADERRHAALAFRAWLEAAGLLELGSERR